MNINSYSSGDILLIVDDNDFFKGIINNKYLIVKVLEFDGFIEFFDGNTLTSESSFERDIILKYDQAIKIITDELDFNRKNLRSLINEESYFHCTDKLYEYEIIINSYKNRIKELEEIISSMNEKFNHLTNKK